jgi:hypothetical protein
MVGFKIAKSAHQQIDGINGIDDELKAAPHNNTHLSKKSGHLEFACM